MRYTNQISAFGRPTVQLGYGQSTQPYDPLLDTTNYTPSSAPLTAAGISTKGAGSLVPQIIGFGGDPMAQALGGVEGVGQVVGVPGGYGTPAADAVGGAGSGIGGIMKNTFLNKNGGLNIDGITSLLGSVGGIAAAIKGYGLAKDTYNLNKHQFETNLANQTKSYNTALEDRARARASYSGISDAETEAYIKRNRL